MHIDEIKRIQERKDHLMRHDQAYLDAIEQQKEIDRKNALGLPPYEKQTPEQIKSSHKDYKRFAKEGR